MNSNYNINNSILKNYHYTLFSQNIYQWLKLSKKSKLCKIHLCIYIYFISDDYTTIKKIQTYISIDLNSLWSYKRAWRKWWCCHICRCDWWLSKRHIWRFHWLSITRKNNRTINYFLTNLSNIKFNIIKSTYHELQVIELYLNSSGSYSPCILRFLESNGDFKCNVAG